LKSAPDQNSLSCAYDFRPRLVTFPLGSPGSHFTNNSPSARKTLIRRKTVDLIVRQAAPCSSPEPIFHVRPLAIFSSSHWLLLDLWHFPTLIACLPPLPPQNLPLFRTVFFLSVCLNLFPDVFCARPLENFRLVFFFSIDQSPSPQSP